MHWTSSGYNRAFVMLPPLPLSFVPSSRLSAESASPPLSVAIVRQRYNPYGGAERFVERALAALAAQGAALTLITRQWQGADDGRFRTLICDPPARGIAALLSRRTARDRAFRAGVQGIVAGEHFDIVQSHERVPGCTIFRAGDGVHAAWLQRRGRLLNRLQRLVQACSPYHRDVLAAEKAMFAHPALKAVICNSRMVADEISAFYGVDRAKLKVIYNGVDTEAFHPRLRDEFRAAQRQALGIPAEAPVLLYVGSGFERKGVPQLLRAFAVQLIDDAHLIVVGADRKLAAMRWLADALGLAGRVHFTGPVQDVRPYYGAADAFALPTLYDPGPNAALEALACGLPLLTSDGCGAKEWVRPGENGAVVDVGDAAALVAGVTAVLRLGAQPAAHAAARAAVEHLSLDAMAAALLALYRELA